MADKPTASDPGHASDPDTDRGLISAFALPAKEHPARVGWDTITTLPLDSPPVWIHLDRFHESAQEWVRTGAGLDPLAAEALLAEETRPRLTEFEGGALLILRGVNLNPGAEPEDMVSLRCWIEEKRLITLRGLRVKAVDDVCARLDEKPRPMAVGGLLALLAAALTERMESVVEDIADEVDALEEEIATENAQTLRGRLSEARRRAIGLRRFMAPQREVLAALATTGVRPMTAADRTHLRETVDRLTRLREDIESTRDRAAVTHEQLQARIADQVNRRVYVLTIVAAVFLPLGLLTGLLGINVGGIPGADFELSFAIVAGALVLLGGVELLLLKLLRWI